MRLSFFAALFFTWLIGQAARGFGGPVGAALESHPLRYLGKISYGLYLFHYLVPQTLARLHVPEPHSWPLRFAYFFAVTIAIASVSWYAFEKPINGLKRFFAYSNRSGPLAKAAVTEPLGAVTPARAGEGNQRDTNMRLARKGRRHRNASPPNRTAAPVPNKSGALISRGKSSAPNMDRDRLR